MPAAGNPYNIKTHAQESKKVLYYDASSLYPSSGRLYFINLIYNLPEKNHVSFFNFLKIFF